MPARAALASIFSERADGGADAVALNVAAGVPEDLWEGGFDHCD